MRTSKFIYAAAFSIALFTTSGKALGNQKSLEEIVKQSTELLDERLDLSDKQEAEVYETSLKYAKKNMELINSSSSQMSKYKTYQSNHKAKEAEMKTILWYDQFLEWKVISEGYKIK